MNEERQRRVADNESLFRVVNEQLARDHERFQISEPAEFLCECGDPSCSERILLTRDEYEEIRSHGARFAIRDGHEIEEVERVVARRERFSIVEKFDVGRRVAEESDPRSE